jgi:dihydroxy-acid dehydratase
LPAEPPRSLTTSAKPHAPTAAIAVLHGSLAPSGAVIKLSAASADLLRHVGPAVVFDGLADMHQRIDDERLEVTPASVLVLRNAGPIGGPGMPEAGAIPIPRRLWMQGVRDMVRISDARMSGTAAGTIVLHVAPEAAVGGPLAQVRDGDLISLDVDAGHVDLLVDPSELAERSRSDSGSTLTRESHRGYSWLHQHHVMQANDGCDFDFLRARQNEPAPLPGGVV